jgi:hypothetical protein
MEEKNQIVDEVPEQESDCTSQTENEIAEPLNERIRTRASWKLYE